MNKRLCSVLIGTFLAVVLAASAALAATDAATAPKGNWKEKLDKAIAAAPFDVGVYVLDVASGDTYQHNADKQFSSASIIKLFILQNLFEQAQKGDVKLTDAIVFDQSKAIPGGMLHKFATGAILRLEDIAQFMLSVSDNTATNLLIDRLGMDRINASIQAMGAKETVLGRKMLDFAAKQQGKDNYTSAQDVAMVLQRFLKADPRILDMLSCQKDNSKLPALWGFDDYDDLEPVFAHKTGELPGFYHDAGILYYKTSHPVIMVVLTGGVPHLATGCAFDAKIGKIIYDAFRTEDQK